MKKFTVRYTTPDGHDHELRNVISLRSSNEGLWTTHRIDDTVARFTTDTLLQWDDITELLIVDFETESREHADA